MYETVQDKAWREHMAFRVEASLNGTGSSTAKQTYDELISVLRSGEPLPQSLRDTIADALERGQISDPGVRLRIEAPPSYFKSLSSAEADDRLLEAGLYIAQEHASGRQYSDIYNDLRDKFNISDVADYGRRSRKIYNELRAFIDENRDEVIEYSQSGELHGYESDWRDYDLFAFARSLFIEQRHGLRTPTT